MIKSINRFILTIVVGGLLFTGSAIGDDANHVVLYEKFEAHESTFLSTNKDVDYEVLYFFNYNCPSCLEFEETVAYWQDNMPENTELKSIPTAVHVEWEWATKLHFFAKKMNPELTRKTIFNTPTLQSYVISTKDDMIATLADELNLPIGAIERTVSKVDVSPMMEKSRELAAKFNVIGTPTLVLNAVGKGVYKVQPNNFLTYKQMMQLVNGIIAYHNKTKK